MKFGSMRIFKYVIVKGYERGSFKTFFTHVFFHDSNPSGSFIHTRMQNIFSYDFDFAEIFARERSPTLIKKIMFCKFCSLQ